MRFLSARSQQVGSGAHLALFSGYRGSFLAGECGPSFRVEVKNAWGYTSILPYILIAWRLIKYTETSCFDRNSSPDSSVGTVISLRAGRLGNRLSVFGRGKRFISSLDRLCGPTGLIYKNHRVLFLGGRSGREVTANVDRHWMLRLNMSTLLPTAY